ncbi:hypothetical protein [Niveispirillum sp. KHB5.9]|uniref:hypothetical protein n=1 Tax=Niveispirillum sp. KHB5.9 TaxID=3400269 RepID=UPI003A8C2C2E
MTITPINVPALIDQIKTSASAILGQNIENAQGFSQDQLAAMAQQAETIAGGIATGEIRPSLQQFFLDQLKQSAQNFVRVLVGLALVTVEQLWNSVVNSLWGALSAATGLNFTAPAWTESGLSTT